MLQQGGTTSLRESIVSSLQGFKRDDLQCAVQKVIGDKRLFEHGLVFGTLASTGGALGAVNGLGYEIATMCVGEGLRGVTLATAATAMGVGGAVAVFGATFTGFGFGPGGITGGSYAASIMGPNTLSGSSFAVAQSLGAQGIVATITTVGAGLVLSGAAVYGGVKLYEKYRQ